MSMKIYVGVLKELGPNVRDAAEQTTSTVYSYIELMDGQMLRNIAVVGGLEGKLDLGLEDHGQVELHIMEGGKKSDLLVAMKTSDGKTYATDLSGGSWMGHVMVAGLGVIGLCLIPAFGLGLVFLWAAWRVRHGMNLTRQARRHVDGLPNAILV